VPGSPNQRQDCYNDGNEIAPALSGAIFCHQLAGVTMRLIPPSFPILAAVLVTAAAAFGLVSSAEAFEMRSYTNGKQLLTVCSQDSTNCYMYVYGVLDVLMLNDDANKTCTFNPDGVAGDKAVGTVLAYLQTHQDRMDWSAAALVQNAIRSKFPCAKKKKVEEPAE
jgi:hypothetical protein